MTAHSTATQCDRARTPSPDETFKLPPTVLACFKNGSIHLLIPESVPMEPVELIIDTDPGIDDALAILLALGHSKVKVAAITTSKSTECAKVYLLIRCSSWKWKCSFVLCQCPQASCACRVP